MRAEAAEASMKWLQTVTQGRRGCTSRSAGDRISFAENITTRNRLQQELKATSFLKRRISYAHDHSQDQKRSRFSTDTPAGKCYICGKPGHKALQCRSRIGARSQDLKPKSPVADVMSRKTSSAASVTCFNCNATGHYAKNCSRRENKEGSTSSMAGPSQEKRVNVCVVNSPEGQLRHFAPSHWDV
ncbi:uncharacterized protein LOC124533119 [Vanessa cardui]|uniref:uncharacterized protein LOC124533119 n=1 Tax=Vanessa cardui TaxID=171605 RepID=UPI001F12F228|nr:uncharacterized protein LOC124533119 [Vanessa cardui]